ncbi:hypothetical protein [Lysobacter fragariae]
MGTVHQPTARASGAPGGGGRAVAGNGLAARPPESMGKRVVMTTDFLHTVVATARGDHR